MPPPPRARPALSLLVCPLLWGHGVWERPEQSPRSRTWLPFSQVLGPELKEGGLCKESSFSLP